MLSAKRIPSINRDKDKRDANILIHANNTNIRIISIHSYIGIDLANETRWYKYSR